MDVVLTPKMNQWISEKVASGLYESPDEVILEGLWLLKRQEEQRLAMIQDLRQELLVGVRQLDAGKSDDFNASVIADIKVRGRDSLEYSMKLIKKRLSKFERKYKVSSGLFTPLNMRFERVRRNVKIKGMDVK
jgi:antitoxin ParD1/3/4